MALRLFGLRTRLPTLEHFGRPVASWSAIMAGTSVTIMSMAAAGAASTTLSPRSPPPDPEHAGHGCPRREQAAFGDPRSREDAGDRSRCF